MKKTYLLIAFGLMSFAALAQSTPRFSIGAELALPTGDFADAVGIGYGASLRYEGLVADRLAITADLGYLFFSGKDVTVGIPGGVSITSEGQSTYLVPIQLGVKYYFVEQQTGFYAQLMAGSHLYELASYAINGNAINREVESKAAFSIAPAIGYHLANVDIGLRYQIVSTSGDATSYAGLRLAYVFGNR